MSNRPKKGLLSKSTRLIPSHPQPHFFPFRLHSQAFPVSTEVETGKAWSHSSCELCQVETELFCQSSVSGYYCECKRTVKMGLGTRLQVDLKQLSAMSSSTSMMSCISKCLMDKINSYEIKWQKKLISLDLIW